jgi:hypothetical protein
MSYGWLAAFELLRAAVASNVLESSWRQPLIRELAEKGRRKRPIKLNSSQEGWLSKQEKYDGDDHQCSPPVEPFAIVPPTVSKVDIDTPSDHRERHDKYD